MDLRNYALLQYPTLKGLNIVAPGSARGWMKSANEALQLLSLNKVLYMNGAQWRDR
ncbi:MAG: hypothetical protein KGY70_20795 [Bacteroidales bacterium]|nr:hypothetical protein [Bacteroidales bacterium]